MTKLDLAIEEFKLFQAIIARQDDISFKIKGLCVTLHVGILALLYNSKINSLLESKYIFFSIMLFMILVFFIWIEAIHRVAMDRALERSAEIEKEIRTNDLKEYPKIGLSLGRNNTPKDQFHAMNQIRLWSPYSIIFLIDVSAIILLS